MGAAEQLAVIALLLTFVPYLVLCGLIARISHHWCGSGFNSESADMVAALTFAVVNVPQAMGHALLAMVNPVLGIYTLMVAVPVGPRPAAFRPFRASCRSWGCLSFR